MTIDAEIAAALDRDDPDGAVLLAAQIKDPAAFLAAMIIVNKARRQMKVTRTQPDGTETEFELEAPEPGHVPARVIDELRRCHREAKDFVAAFADATKAQAEKHGVKPGALRRYIVALEADKVDDVEKEIADLNRLIDEGAT